MNIDIDFILKSAPVAILTGALGFLYAKKLESIKFQYAKDLESIKKKILSDLQQGLEEIKIENSKQVEKYKRIIDNALKEKEMLVDTKLKAQLNANNAVFSHELSIYTEVTELLYRCRNLSRDCLSITTRNRENIRDYFQYVHHFIENLYKYKLFFSDEDIFRNLHEFKCKLQEYCVLLNQITRSTEIEDAAVDSEVSSMTLTQMEANYAEINSLYELLSMEIQKIVRAKSSFDSIDSTFDKNILEIKND